MDDTNQGSDGLKTLVDSTNATAVQTSTLDNTVDSLADTSQQSYEPRHATNVPSIVPSRMEQEQLEPYTPVFTDKMRTGVYVLCLIAGVVSIVVTAMGHEDWGTVVSQCATLIAAGFGVAYNPVRMGSK